GAAILAASTLAIKTHIQCGRNPRRNGGDRKLYQEIRLSPREKVANDTSGVRKRRRARPNSARAGKNHPTEPRFSEYQGKEKMIANVMEPVSAKGGVAMPELSEQLEKDVVQVFKLLSDETRL